MIPTLDAYRFGRQLWTWCAHEKRWHYHGACTGCTGPCTCPPGSSDGHRVAHCGCRCSPLYAFGYNLREVGELTPEIQRAHRPSRGYHRCPEPCPALAG